MPIVMTIVDTICREGGGPGSLSVLPAGTGAPRVDHSSCLSPSYPMSASRLAEVGK